MAAKTTSHVALNSELNTNNTVVVRVILRKGRGRWYLYTIGVSREMSGEALMVKIRELYAKETPTWCCFGRGSCSTQRPVLAIGTLSTVSMPHIFHSDAASVSQLSRSIIQTCSRTLTKPQSRRWSAPGSSHQASTVRNFFERADLSQQHSETMNTYSSALRGARP